MKYDTQIIFFDGLCNLCNGAVQFAIKRDSRHIFRFSSLQSDYAREKLASFASDSKHWDSMILFEEGKLYHRSTAALRVARKLNGLWPLLYGFIIVPRSIRDTVYDLVSTNRYKWFGKRGSCWIPTPELRERFL